jgi:outer membrane receptor protein involved in Fe transport
MNRFGPNDAVGVPDFQAPSRIINAQDNFTQELRIQSLNRDARFTWVAGLFYQDAKQHNVERGESAVNAQTGESDYDRLYRRIFGRTVLEVHGFPLFEGMYSYITDTNVEEAQRAAFLDASWQATDKLSVSAGVRVSEVEFSFVAGRASNTQADWTYNSGGADERAVTPRFGVSYEATDDLMIYANAAKGFRGGGANSSSIIQRCAQYIAELGIGDVSQYDSDIVWSYDVGVKGTTLAGRLAYDVGAYVIDWEDIQQSNALFGCGLSYIGNFGSARAQGGDITLQAAATDDLLIDLSVGYMNSEYSELVRSSSAPNATILINEGNSLPNVTPWKIALGGTYNFDLFGKESYIRADWEHSSRASDLLPTQDPTTSQYNPTLPIIDANNRVRLRAGMRFGELEISAFADNLLDSAPVLAGSAPRMTEYYTVSTWRPRTLGMTAVYRY